MPIKDWPARERPREKLLAMGPQALSEAELLAVFLRTGVAGHDVLEIARNALHRFKGLNGLFAAARGEVESLAGFGPAKYAQLAAVIELARRALREDVQHAAVLGSPQKVREYLSLSLAHAKHEIFAALFLDAQNRLIEHRDLFHGTLTQTSVYPREVVREALRCNAAGVILAHNHPSGAAEPSRADELLTRTLREALTLIDVKVLDHIIVAGPGRTVSFAERGLL
ncbi:MAG TPA: DNA repair protein RadC [Burkholderiaceae bacterium]|nr:DNA repair protein RadC [Burkholderiaceae bacterium]